MKRELKLPDGTPYPGGNIQLDEVVIENIRMPWHIQEQVVENVKLSIAAAVNVYLGCRHCLLLLPSLSIAIAVAIAVTIAINRCQPGARNKTLPESHMPRWGPHPHERWWLSVARYVSMRCTTGGQPFSPLYPMISVWTAERLHLVCSFLLKWSA